MSEDGAVRITVPLVGRRVVVVGGGCAALGRVARLLRAGAAVEVFAPAAEPAVEDLADRGEIVWRRRAHRAADLERAWLVVAATGTAATDAAVLLAAQAAGVWGIGPGHGALDDAASPPDGSAPLDAPAASPDAAAAPGPGSVTLVGGGPGDEGLLTVAGARALRCAQVVVVDRLAPLGLLDTLATDVEVVDVSKIPRGRATPQEDINAVLVDRARAGRRVVRLKGGDPYVFGRGMEEVLACREAGVPVHVVPGVSSAVAGPALSGIPVTHRGLSQGFTVVSGHVPPGDPRSEVDWAALARGRTTLVLLMAVEHLAAIARALLEAGMADEVPVACIMDAALPRQRTLVTSLGAVATGAHAPQLQAPAVTVIGDVAAFADAARPACTVPS